MRASIESSASTSHTAFCCLFESRITSRSHFKIDARPSHIIIHKRNLIGFAIFFTWLSISRRCGSSAMRLICTASIWHKFCQELRSRETFQSHLFRRQRVEASILMWPRTYLLSKMAISSALCRCVWRERNVETITASLMQLSERNWNANVVRIAESQKSLLFHAHTHTAAIVRFDWMDARWLWLWLHKIVYLMKRIVYAPGHRNQFRQIVCVSISALAALDEIRQN